MEESRLSELEKIYRDGLLKDTLPFWINNSVDREQHCTITGKKGRNGLILQGMGLNSLKSMDLTVMEGCFFTLTGKASQYEKEGISFPIPSPQ